jgi:hypothetical protein
LTQRKADRCSAFELQCSCVSWSNRIPSKRQNRICGLPGWKKECPMKNPWTRKNPFLSMWLSGANAIAGSVRSRAAAEGKRQATTAMSKSMKQVTDFWTGGLLAKPAPRRRKKRG